MPYGKGISPLIPSFTYQPVQIAEELVAGFLGTSAVDVGSGGRRIAPWVKTVDLVAMPEVDYVCDFVKGKMPFEDSTMDLAIATGVLEHVEDEVAFMNEMIRILKVGGTIHIELPFLQQYHEDPIDCRRFTLPGLRMFLEKYGFEIVNSGVHIGPTVTVLTLFSYYLDLVFGGETPVRKLLGNGVFVVFSVLAWPLRYIDRWLIHKPNAHRLAYGVFATGVKRTREFA